MLTPDFEPEREAKGGARRRRAARAVCPCTTRQKTRTRLCRSHADQIGLRLGCIDERDALPWFVPSPGNGFYVDGRPVLKPEIQAEVDQIMVGFRQECLRVLEETARLRGRLPEPPEGWREYFTRRIYTALLKYKEKVEAVVEAHLAADERI